MNLSTRTLFLACSLSALCAAPAARQAASGVDVEDTRMLAQPATSAEHVAFVYAGDLWVTGAEGGTARRLTSLSLIHI